MVRRNGKKIYREMSGFLSTPKNSKVKHMSHPTGKGSHMALELKKLDEDSYNKRK